MGIRDMQDMSQVGANRDLSLDGRGVRGNDPPARTEILDANQATGTTVTKAQFEAQHSSPQNTGLGVNTGTGLDSTPLNVFDHYSSTGNTLTAEIIRSKLVDVNKESPFNSGANPTHYR